MIAPCLREDCCNPPLAEQKDLTEDPDLSFPPLFIALSLCLPSHRPDISSRRLRLREPGERGARRGTARRGVECVSLGGANAERNEV